MRRLLLLLILLSALAFAQNTVVTGESAGASTNPTSGTIPAKCGAIFCDSHIIDSVNFTVDGSGNVVMQSLSVGTGNTGQIDLGTSVYHGATSGTSSISVSATGGTLNLGSVNATVSSAGAHTAPSFTTNGTNAGVHVFTQGPDNGAQAANTATWQAPTAVTSYRADLPPANPVNNSSGFSCTNATPSICTFAKMPVLAFITSNYTNATTTFSNVTGLSFAVEASTNYKVRCDLDYQTSATTADIKIQWTGPASPTAVTYDMVTEVTGSTLSAAVATAFSTSLSEAGTPTITTNFPLTLTLTLINGANAGTVQLQAAATGVGTVTIIPGSCQAQ